MGYQNFYSIIFLKLLIYQNLSGKVLHTSHFNPQQGIQYFMEIPTDLPNGEYIFKIQGKEFQQAEKIIILR